MRVLRAQDMGAAVVFLVLAAGPARPESPAAGSAFSFRVTQATVTKASQNVLSGLKFDPGTGEPAIVASPAQPKEGRVFVLLKVEVRNHTGRQDTVVCKDLVFKGANGQPIPYMVLLSPPQPDAVPMYSDGVTGMNLEPNETKTEDFLLNAPGDVGAMTLRYGSLPAVRIDVVVPSEFRRWPVRWYYLACAAAGILIVGAMVYLFVRRRNPPKESAGTLGPG